jgi:hypothetical protein
MHLFHSQMWVKGTPLQFIVDSGSHKNLISDKVFKRLAMPTTSHPQHYTIGWLCQGRDIHVSQQCSQSYDIKPFKDEVLCDVSPLEVCNVLLGQPYFTIQWILLWKGSSLVHLPLRGGILLLSYHSKYNNSLHIHYIA